MKRIVKEVVLASFIGAALAILSIQLHMIHSKRAEIAQIVSQQKVLVERLSQFRVDINRYLSSR